MSHDAPARAIAAPDAASAKGTRDEVTSPPLRRVPRAPRSRTDTRGSIACRRQGVARDARISDSHARGRSRRRKYSSGVRAQSTFEGLKSFRLPVRDNRVGGRALRDAVSGGLGAAEVRDPSSPRYL